MGNGHSLKASILDQIHNTPIRDRRYRETRDALQRCFIIESLRELFTRFGEKPLSALRTSQICKQLRFDDDGCRSTGHRSEEQFVLF